MSLDHMSEKGEHVASRKILSLLNTSCWWGGVSCSLHALDHHDLLEVGVQLAKRIQIVAHRSQSQGVMPKETRQDRSNKHHLK
eukprot:6192915-Amphidinium_carterae.1